MQTTRSKPPSSSSSSSSSSFFSSSFSSPSSSSSSLWVFLVLLLLLSTSQVTHGKATDVLVQSVKTPHPGVVGSPARLECRYTVGSQGFYSVRWYKNDEQFYSYVPRSHPIVKVDHELEGVDVELSKSDDRVVTLRALRMDSEGNYRCEVMSEAPNFKSSIASANLTVVVVPEVPELSGLRERYVVGDEVNVTCAARDGRPPARLRFYIDNREIHPGSGRVRELPSTPGSYSGVYNSRASLRLPVRKGMVPLVSVKCAADVLGEVTEVTASLEVEEHRSLVDLLFSAGNVVTPALTTLALVLLVAPSLPRLLQGPS